MDLKSAKIYLLFAIVNKSQQLNLKLT